MTLPLSCDFDRGKYKEETPTLIDFTLIDCLFAREKIFRQIRCPYLYPWLYFCVRYQELFWLQISFSLSTSWLFGHWCCFSSFSSSIFMSHHIFCIFVVRKSLMKWTIHVVRSLKEWFWFLSFHLLFSLFSAISNGHLLEIFGGDVWSIY